jgi:hypothetical protein
VGAERELVPVSRIVRVFWNSLDVSVDAELDVPNPYGEGLKRCTLQAEVRSVDAQEVLEEWRKRLDPYSVPVFKLGPKRPAWDEKAGGLDT